MALALAAALSALTGCQSAPSSAGASGAAPVTTSPAVAGAITSTHTLTVDGLTRSYLVVAPAAQRTPLPLLIVLHGVDATPTGELNRDQFGQLAAAGKAILIYPAGYQKSWNVGVDNCCGQAGRQHVDDLAFIARVRAAAMATLSIRAGQIYLVGFSNGGKLGYDVMCREPWLFDAFAAVSATPIVACTAPSPPPKSVLVTAGSADPELPISDRPLPAAQAVADAAATWRRRDRCVATSERTKIRTAMITTWPACANRTQVRTVLYPGLGHIWPGSQLVGTSAAGATLIWQFLTRSTS
ncbi:MAG: alpha/beta hydrolase family esterase [Trebonia sp.]